MYDKRRNKQFFFGLKRIQHRDSIFYQNFGCKLHRSRYFEARYLEIEKKDVGKKIVYFRTPVALYIPKFIVKNKKKNIFLEGIEKCFPKQKSHYRISENFKRLVLSNVERSFYHFGGVGKLRYSSIE